MQKLYIAKTAEAAELRSRSSSTATAAISPRVTEGKVPCDACQIYGGTKK